MEQTETDCNTPRHGIEVRIEDEWVVLREEGDPGTSTLRFTTEEWVAFVEGAKVGDFDLP
jgi:hypothetical protein